MRLEVLRHSLRIVPETEADVAFIEDTLGLEAAGDMLNLVRYNIDADHRLRHLDARGPLTTRGKRTR